MKCRYCGKDLREGALFCDGCGMKVEQGPDAGSDQTFVSGPMTMAPGDHVLAGGSDIAGSRSYSGSRVPHGLKAVGGHTTANGSSGIGGGHEIGGGSSGASKQGPNRLKIVLGIAGALVLVLIIAGIAGVGGKSGTSSGADTTDTTAQTGATDASQTKTTQTATVDKSKLYSAIADFNSTTEGNYSPETYSTYKTAADAGQTVAASSTTTQAEVDAATKAITDAQAALDFVLDDPAYYWTEAYVTYDDLARYPDQHKDQLITMSGKVIQVIEDSGTTGLRVAVDDDYDQVMLVVYDPSIVSGRVLEDDEVTFYARSAGTTSYTTVLGATLTIPAAYAYMLNIG